jgi:SAM-dependent methyltransferase
MRDTDADWRRIGATQPYWGVLTQPTYLTENLTPAAVEAFYASGRDDIAGLVEKIEQVSGVRPGGRALDFGCGAGRLTEAMSAYAAEATGYDISPGMLEKARARGGRAAYVDALPDGPFDWINSFIVFQHIPPTRGLQHMQALLDRLAPGGLVSLQVTVWREAHLQPAQGQGWRRLAGGLRRGLGLGRPAPGVIHMYDYDLSAVVKLLNQAGVAELTLVPTDHGGHHGVIILGRKSA